MEWSCIPGPRPNTPLPHDHRRAALSSTCWQTTSHTLFEVPRPKRSIHCLSLRRCRCFCPTGYRTVPTRAAVIRAAATSDRCPSRGPIVYSFLKGLSSEASSTCHFRGPVRLLTTSGRLSGFGRPSAIVRNSTNFADCLTLDKREASIVRKWTNPRNSSGS